MEELSASLWVPEVLEMYYYVALFVKQQYWISPSLGHIVIFNVCEVEVHLIMGDVL